MITDKNRVYDGWMSLEAGVDAGRTPTLLEPNFCVSAENMVFRGGHPTTRPGFRKIYETNPDTGWDGFQDFLKQVFCWNQTFQDPGGTIHIVGEYADPRIITPENSEYVYRNGIMQCAIGYSPHHGDDCIMAMIGGRLFKIVPAVNTAAVTEIVVTDDPMKHPLRNRENLPVAYMVQADKWLVVQDGESRPILYDGSMCRRAVETTDPNKTEVPTGTIMAYGMGRICVVVNERDVAFGDLYGSHAGPDPADSLILFTERNFLAGGFDAAIPFQQGVATGAAFFPQLDTSTGNGQLLVFSERGASAFFLSLPRDQWQTSQFQIQALLTTGLRGHRSISVVNEDLWFRAEDGFRSYRQARSEPSGWAHIPLSTNVRQFLDMDTASSLGYASSIYFDNRIIGTCTPSWNQGRPMHDGMVVVDFDILSSFGSKFRPAWDGHWQKQRPLGKPQIRITQLLTAKLGGATRAFAFGVEPVEVVSGDSTHIELHNQLYEISLNDKDDWDGLIEWELVSRSFDFSKLSQQGNPFTETELYDGDIWLREIIE